MLVYLQHLRQIRNILRKHIDILIFIITSLMTVSIILGVVLFLKIQNIQTTLDRNFTYRNQVKIKKLLQKIDLLPDVIFTLAKNKNECKERIKSFNNNIFFELSCSNKLLKNTRKNNNIIISTSRKDRNYRIILNTYVYTILNYLKDLYERIDFGTVRLLYNDQNFILQNIDRNVQEVKICVSKKTCLMLGYGELFMSKLKQELFKEYCITLFLIEFFLVFVYIIFKKQYQNLIFKDLREKKNNLCKQVTILNKIVEEQTDHINNLKKREEALNNSASFQVLWMSRLNKSLKDSIIKIAFKEKDNFELHSYLLSLMKSGDMLKIYPKEIESNILKLGRYIALSSQIKINFIIKQSSMIEIYIHEMVFLNIVYSLAYNIFSKSIAKSDLRIVIDSNDHEFLMIFKGAIINMSDDSHPVFENFHRIKYMVEESGGTLTVQKFSTYQNIVLSFPIRNKDDINSKVININKLKKG